MAPQADRATLPQDWGEVLLSDRGCRGLGGGADSPAKERKEALKARPWNFSNFLVYGLKISQYQVILKSPKYFY